MDGCTCGVRGNGNSGNNVYLLNAIRPRDSDSSPFLKLSIEEN